MLRLTAECALLPSPPAAKGMSKTDLSPEQATARSAAIEIFEGAGWSPTTGHVAFDTGQWSRLQVEMERADAGLSARVEIRVSRGALFLHLRVGLLKDLLLEIEYGDRMLDLVRQIVAGQSGLTPATYKREIKRLHTICPTMYRIQGDKRTRVVG